MFKRILFLQKSFLSLFITFLSFYPTFVSSLDRHHFYRAGVFYDEPRFCREGLITFNAAFFGGSTDTSLDCDGKKVPLLAFHGLENLKLPVEGGDDLLQLKPFGYSGKFDIFEFQLHGFFNFKRGFFVHGHLPFRSMRIHNLERGGCFNSKSHKKKNESHKDKCSDSWCVSGDPLSKSDSEAFEDYLRENGLSLRKTFDKSSIGDFSLLFGWSGTNYETCKFDFIDGSFQLGILFPTGRERDLNAIFSLPSGYDCHYGFPLVLDFAVGFWNWLNIGLHLENIFFASKTRDRRVRNSKVQSGDGFIRFEKIKDVKEDLGSILDFSLYAKADCFLMGFSFLLGYSHIRQSETHLFSRSSDFNFFIANANDDRLLRGWSMNVLHVALEHDWVCDDNPFGPKIRLEYDHLISGKNVFKNSVMSGSIGFHFSWCF